MELTGLNDFLEAQQIKTDDQSKSTYGRDWTKHYTPNPSAVLFPKSTEEVQSIVKWARNNKVALVPSGGRTGLSAAAYAINSEVVVSFDRMNKIMEFNSVDQIVFCQAGVVTEQLQNYAEEQGYYFPVDFAARGSSQIGGNLATNAGGIKVIRYGLTRNWVAGLTVVTGEGEILKLNNGLIKNASGYDLRQLFIGSEGTLGFITEASMFVTRQPKDPMVFVFAIPKLDGVMNVYQEFRNEFPLMAYEMFTDLALKYVLAQGHLSKPTESDEPFYVLLELENDSEDCMDKAMQVFEKCMEQGWISDGTVSQSPQQAKDLWRLREDITEATAHRQPYKNDVSVRISKVPEFLQAVTETMQGEYPDYEVVWFGHIGDGNLHINILKPDTLTSEEFIQNCKRVDEILFNKIESFGGSVSAEHGVGLTKKPFLHHTRSAEEIILMKRIKTCFDPDGIMNPGKVF